MLGAHFFYQVSEEEITRAQTLAGMLEIPLPHAIGMALVVKRAAIRVSGTSGSIPGDPAAWCAAQIGWPQADARRLLDALLCAGHVLAIAGPSPSHSVAFLGPLQAMEETAKKRSEAGRKGAETRKSKGGYGRAMAGPQPSDSHGMARDGKKEMEREMETDPSFSAADIRRSAEVIQSGLFGVEPPTPPAKPAKKPREKKPPPDRPTDPRHAPLVTALTADGWPFDGGKDAANVKGLLALADQQEATRGELAGMEVLRRARIAWAQFPSFHSARTLAGLRSKWGEFATPEAHLTGPPRMDPNQGILRPSARACAACDHDGDGARIGEPSVWLCYQCLGAWQDEGLHFTMAAEWATTRKRAT